jgi:hypothetical protein
VQIVIEVCDICGKKHGTMLKRDGMVFGDRECFLDFCNSVWLEWEKEEYIARGVLPPRKTAVAMADKFVKLVDLKGEGLPFKPKVIGGSK